MDRVTREVDTNVVMGNHEVGEGDPNRVVGEEEAVDEIGIEEGIGIGTEEIGREIPDGRREVGEEVVQGGANAHGREGFPSMFDTWSGRVELVVTSWCFEWRDRKSVV